ncbi:hypothetical protein GCM10027422_10900 [Hymenobacter arcticus]
MSSFYAELEVAGQTYPVTQCQYGFDQPADERGRVRARVRHGLLHLVLNVPDDDQLLNWANTPHQELAGHVTFFAGEQAQETVSFTAGMCVGYQETFVAGRGQDGAYQCALTITTTALVLTAGGPNRPFVAPAARDHGLPAQVGNVAAVAATAQAAFSATKAATTPAADWMSRLAPALGAAATVRPQLAKWVQAGLSASKLQQALTSSANPQQVLERLQLADKGLYQQRVVLDDYANIPGVSPQLYKQNGLPDAAIPASAFGVADAAYDLPARNALTFAGSAKLTALQPGEKIYRVACDPATDPYGQTGGYWTRTPPAHLADVVGGTAVMPEWNNFERVYELTVPTPDPATAGSLPAFHAWEGPTAAQPVSGLYPEKQANGYSLPGGAPQLFLPNNLTRHPDFTTHIQDVSATHKSW